MNKELFKSQQWILDSPSPQDCMTLADTYIEMYNRSPSNFRLPQEHLILMPVIEAFHNKLGAFVEFVREVRDSVAHENYVEMHELYRRVNSRYVQIERRRRLGRATILIEEALNLGFTYRQKQAVQNWLEGYWGMERADKLNEARGAGKNLRLSAEERAEICDLFWKTVDDNLKNNIVPTPPEIVYGKLASIDSNRFKRG